MGRTITQSPSLAFADVTGKPSTLAGYGVSTAPLDVALGQIQFPAVQNASAGANVLDDYEEGAWTPADVSGAGLVFAGVTARYTKVGRLVVVQFGFSFPATASGAGAGVSGLPFAASAGGGMSGGFVSSTNAGFLIVLEITASSVNFYLVKSDGTAVTNVEMSGKFVRGTLVYSV